MKRILMITILLVIFTIAISACDVALQATKETPTSTLRATSKVTANKLTQTLPVIASITPSLAPTKTKQPTATSRPTKSPTIASSVTPTPLPTVALSFPDVLAGTLFPEPQSTISSENANQTHQLARFGKGYVNDLIYSSRGGFLAVGTTTGVYVYDRSLMEILYLETLESVEQLAFSPQSDRLAGVLSNETVMEWSLDNGRVMQTLDGVHVGYTPDERLLVIQQPDPDGRTVQVISFPSQAILTAIDDAYSYQRWDGFRFAPDASFVLITERLNLSSLEKFPLDVDEPPFEFSEYWDSEGEEWEYYCSGVTSMTVSRNAEYVAKGCIELGIIYIWRAEEDTPVQKINSDSWIVDALAFSPDASYIAAATELGGVGIWRVSDGALLQKLPGTWGTVDALVYSPNGEFLVAGYHNGLVRQWNVLDGSIVADLHDYASTGENLVFSPEGDRLVNIAGNGVRFLDLHTGRPVLMLLARQKSTNVVKLAKTMPKVVFRSGPMGMIVGFTFSDDWSLIVTYKDIGDIYLWETDTGTLLRTVSREEYPSFLEYLQGIDADFANRVALLQEYGYVRISPNQEFAIVEANAGTVGTLKNIESGRSCLEISGWWKAAFSADSAFLAVPYKQSIRVYRTADCQLDHIYGMHAASVGALAFSPDGNLLASGSEDGTIILWDVNTGSMLTILRGHTGFFDAMESGISGLAFSPDNRYLASGGLRDGTIRIWGIAP